MESIDFLLILILVSGLAFGVWFVTTILLPSTLTVEVSNETRLLAYYIDRPKKADGSHLIVYGPGMHTLGVRIKPLLRIQTTPRVFKEKVEEFDTHNVQMKWQYEYEVWLVRTDQQPSDLPAGVAGRDEDTILDWAARQVYLTYGHPDYKDPEGRQINRWDDVMDRTIREELETIGRLFTPDELYNPEEFRPKAIIVNNVIKQVISRNELPPLYLPRGAVEVEIKTPEELFTLVANHMVTEVNRQHRANHGLELRPTKFAIHNIEYKDDELRKTAEQRQRGKLLEEATAGLIASGRAESPQEAMLIALRQDARYADLVMQTRWQNVVRHAIDSSFGRITPEAIERIISRLERVRGDNT